MNMLLAYDHADWQRTDCFPERWFSKQAIDITPFPLETTAYWTDWKHRLPFYITKGFPVPYSAVEKKLKKKFDFIFELDGSIPYHLAGMRKVSAKKALWSFDTYRTDKQKFHGWIEKDFDIVFVLQKHFVSFFKRAKTFWMPCACDHTVHKKYPLPKIYDVAFIGNVDPQYYPERAKLLDRLKSKFKVTVFSNFFGNETTKFGSELTKIYSQSKIVFNKSGFGEINFRVFEALGCGSMLISDRLREEVGLETLFQDGKHLVLYNSPDDLMDKVSYFLQHEEEREKIALEGQKEVLAKHTFEHRARKMLEIMRSV